MKYLTDIEVRTLLNLGKTIEMFIPKEDKNDILTWVSVQRGDQNNFLLHIYSVYDDGNVDHVDIYEFSPIDPDETCQTIKFEKLDELLTNLKVRFSLSNFRFVNQGLVHEEYRLLKLIDTSPPTN